MNFFDLSKLLIFLGPIGNHKAHETKEQEFHNFIEINKMRVHKIRPKGYRARNLDKGVGRLII